MVLQLVDKLIPKIQTLNRPDLFAQRCLIISISIIGTVAIFSHILNMLELANNPFPFRTIMVIVPILLFINIKSANTALVVNTLNFLLAIVIGYAIVQTGGIYSSNVKWLLVIFLFAVLFLPLRQILLWVIVIISMITFSISFYKGDFIIPYSDNITYLLENLTFVFIFSSFILIYYRTQLLLREDILNQKQAIESQTIKLQLQSKQLEELSQKLKQSNQSLKNYAHATSHDLKQPVRTINSFTELIKKDIQKNKVSEKTEEKIDLVIESSRKINKMINDILYYAEVEQIDKLEKEQIAMSDILLEVKIRLSSLIQENNVQIFEEELRTISANSTQIVRVFQNIISNAIKYSNPNKNPQIQISAASTEQHTTICIQDNGLGIQQNQLVSIFNPFVQGNKEKNNGYGIGLATCKEIVAKHGGKIWAESSLGEWSKFYIQLPN